MTCSFILQDLQRVRERVSDTLFFMIKSHMIFGLVATFAVSLATVSCQQESRLQSEQPMPPEFCYVDEVAPSIRADLKYSGSDNFVGRPIAGYRGSRPILRRDAAAALQRVQQRLVAQGYGLIIWDAYRPMRALSDFRAWSRTSDSSTRATFYPRLTKKGIYEGHYIGDSSEHTWGIAVDLSLVHLSDGRLVDMGGRHDLLDPSSATESPEVSEQARANRRFLRDAMRAEGFVNYGKEWWHYRLANSRPWYAYDFPVRDDLRVH